VDALPPEVGGVAYLDVAVLDEQIHRLVALAVQQESVEPGPFEPCSGPAAVVRIGDRPRQR